MPKKKRKEPKFLHWSSRVIIIEPFPNTPIDFDKLDKALRKVADGLSSSPGEFKIQTMETPGEIARALAKAGIEASEIYERTRYTVMRNWRK